jgi:putative sigma-54 modulation protein
VICHCFVKCFTVRLLAHLPGESWGEIIRNQRDFQAFNRIAIKIKLKLKIMKINIQGIAFTLKKELTDFVNRKAKKLKHLYNGIISIDISLKISKSETKDNKVCRIRLVIPGYDMLAGAQCQTFESATAIAIEALERQIEKRKNKLLANRVVKNQLMLTV